MGVRISNITETTTMADANTLPTDTTSGTRRISWANLKTAIFGAINGLTSKSTPVGADVIVIGDSAAGFAGKKAALNTLAGAIMPYAKLSDTKAANTNGGGITAGSWVTRSINTKDTDADGIVSISANQFTLQAGTYRTYATAPAVQVNRHKIKLRNITDSTDTLIGSSAYASASYGGHTLSTISGQFTIAGAKAFEIQHRVESTNGTNGGGVESNFSVSEVYTIVELWKVA
jgi:hypothetical protein